VIVYISDGIAGINETYAKLSPKEVVKEVVVDYNSAGVDQTGFWASVRVKFEEPDPSMGNFYFVTRLKWSLMNLNPLLWVDVIYFTITRETWGLLPIRGLKLTWYDGMVQLHVVSYEESVTSRLGTNHRNSIEIYSRSTTGMPPVEAQQWLNISADYGDVIVQVLPDLLVDHWEEYVEYGYWDWLTAMGGLFSIICVVYFSVSYHVGLKLGHDTFELGILSEMSLIHRNIEHIHVIKKFLNQRHKRDDQNVAAESELELTVWKKEGDCGFET